MQSNCVNPQSYMSQAVSRAHGITKGRYQSAPPVPPTNFAKEGHPAQLPLVVQGTFSWLLGPYTPRRNVRRKTPLPGCKREAGPGFGGKFGGTPASGGALGAIECRARFQKSPQPNPVILQTNSCITAPLPCRLERSKDEHDVV